MLRITAFGVVLVFLVSAAIYWIFFHRSVPQTVRVTGAAANLTSPVANYDEKIKDLESKIEVLREQFLKTDVSSNKQSTVQISANANLGTRVAVLENAVTLLQQKMAQLPSPTTQPAQSTKAPVFIPLGASNQSNDRNYVSVESFITSFNPDDFAGFTSMQLEVIMKLNEQVGTAYAQLYNETDGQSVALSEVSTGNTKFTFLQSGGFKLGSGKKMYRLQVKSTQGYTVSVQSAQVRVNF